MTVIIELALLVMRDSFQLRKRKEMVVLGIRGIKLLTYVVFISKLTTWKVEEFHDESFGFWI